MKRTELNEQNYFITYNKADELPLKRYAKMQKYLLYKTGVGSDIESVGEHFQKLHGFINHQMMEDIEKEAENLHYNFFSILQEVSYIDLAFVNMIYSINGELLTDISEENLLRIIDWLSNNGMTHEMVSQQIQDTRSSIIKDLKLYFPKFYPESEDYTFFQKTKQRLMLTADKILAEIEGNAKATDDEILRLLHEISLFFTEMNKPKNFNPEESDNCIIKLESHFESLCSMIESNGGSSPKDFTLIEFYSRLEFIRKSNEPLINK